MSKLKKLNRLNKSKTLSVALALGLVASNLVSVAPAFATSTAHSSIKLSSTKTTLNITTASFDKKSPADVSVVFTPVNGYTLKAIKYGSKTLAQGTDYTLDADTNTVTISKDYLLKQTVGTKVLKFDFSAGTDPSLRIIVKDTSAKINLPKTTFDSKHAKDVKVKLTLNGNNFVGVSNDGTELVNDTDYTVSGSFVTIKKEYLLQQMNGHTYLTFNFDAGINPVLDVTVKNSGVVEATVKSVSAVNVTTEAGTAPVLPKTVTAAMSDNTTKEVDVTWDAIDASKYAEEGSFDVAGTIAGTTIKAKATVTVTAKAVDPQVAIVKAATDAVAAYEAAPVTTLAEVTAAEALEVTATADVALVTDTTTKDALTARIAAKKAAVDAAKVLLSDVIAPTIDTAGSAVVDYQTLKVAFSEKVKGTPAVTVNAVAEPNVALAADGLSMTITRTAGFAAGGYDIVVNGLTDAAGNAMAANAAVTLTKSASYVADFGFATTGLDATAVNHKVYFTAIDQYGQDITSSLAGTLDDNIVATATMGQLPLDITYAPGAGDNGHNYFTITDNLIAATNVTVTMTNTVDNKSYTKSKSYTVAAAAAPVPTSVSAISHAIGNDITVDDDNQAISLTVLDQYGNPMEAGDVGDVKWVTSNKAVLAFTGNTSANFETTNDNLTNNVDAIAPGTATISVFLAGSTTPNATLQVNVGTSALSSLGFSNSWDQTYNQEVSTEKITPNAGAVVTAADLKCVVDAFPEGASASDLAVTFVDGTDADAGKILVKATTAKAGTYQFRVYKGAAPTANGAVVSATRTLTTTINPTVNSIAVTDFTPNELTAGTTVKKDITFRNVHGEVVNVNAQDISVASTANMAVTAYDAAGNPLTIGTSATPVAKLGFTGTAAATDSVTIVTGAVSKTLAVTTAAAATLTNFSLDTASATVIDSDTHDTGDGTGTDNVMLDNSGDTVVLIPISFSDQYGNAMTVNAGDFDMSFTGTTPGTAPVFALYGAKADGTTALADDAATAVKYIGVKAQTGDTSQTVTLQMRNEADSASIGTSKTVAVTVNAARALASISAAPTTGSSVVGVPVTFTLSGVDQYGVPVDLDEDDTQLQTLTNVEIGNKAPNSTDGNKSDFTLTASAAGNYSATIFYSTDGTLDAGEKSTNVSITAGLLANVVNRIQIQPTVTVADSNADGTYDAKDYSVALDGSDPDQTVTFTVKAYDAAGNEVAINQTGDVIYTVSNDSVENGSISFTNNVATVNMTGAFTATDKFTVKATSLNGKEDTIVITPADIDDAAAQNGKYYFAATSNGTTPLTSLDVNADATLNIVGVNQFGKPVDITENSTPVLAVAEDNNAVITHLASANGIYIAGKTAGSTILRAIINDGSQLAIPVTVSTVDATAPTLTAGAVTHTDVAVGTVKFTSNEVGRYYYAVVADGAAAPTIDTSGAGSACTTSETTITNPTGLATGANDIYIVVKDLAGNISSSLKIDIPSES